MTDREKTWRPSEPNHPEPDPLYRDPQEEMDRQRAEDEGAPVYQDPS